jgi:hypothetical protein
MAEMPKPPERVTGDSYMDNMEIVRQLVQGSENLDRMKKTTECVVLIFLGLLKINLAPSENRVCPLKGEPHWIVYIDSGRPSISCRIKEGPDQSSLRFSSEEGLFRISLRDVQATYDALPLLVEGMRKEFPFMEKDLEYIFKASCAF